MRHDLRNTLVVFHVCGLLSLPNYYAKTWKNRLHRVYSVLVVTFYISYLVSVTLTLIIYCSRDFSEFCEKFFEWIIGVDMGFSILYMNRNIVKVQKMFDMFEEFEYYHRHNPVLFTWKRRTERITFLGWRIQAFVITVLNLLPLLPIPESEQERLHRIYDLKYPQNTLAFPIYVPFVDPSEPTAYVILYFVMLYVGFIGVPLSFLVCYPYPILVVDFKYYTQVVCEFFQRIGHVHRDGQGQLIFFTNVIRNEYILQDIKEGEADDLYTPDGLVKSEKVPGLRSVFLRRPDLYEYFYLSQVVLFQKRLSCLREELDDVFSGIFNFCAITCLAGLMMSAYSFLLPSTSSIGLIKRYVEGPILIVSYMVVFACGELLADCNNRLNRALYYSLWYGCCNTTRRGVVLVLRITEKNIYVSIYNLFDMGFKMMVSTFRLVYSFFGLMNLQRSYLQKN